MIIKCAAKVYYGLCKLFNRNIDIKLLLTSCDVEMTFNLIFDIRHVSCIQTDCIVFPSLCAIKDQYISQKHGKVIANFACQLQGTISITRDSIQPLIIIIIIITITITIILIIIYDIIIIYYYYLYISLLGVISGFGRTAGVQITDATPSSMDDTSLLAIQSRLGLAHSHTGYLHRCLYSVRRRFPPQRRPKERRSKVERTRRSVQVMP